MPDGMSDPSESINYVDWPTFSTGLTALLNMHGIDSFAGTPDNLLAQKIIASLTVDAVTTYEREKWFGRAGA